MTVEEPKQLGEIVIEIAGRKLQVAECENGMLLCSEDGTGKKKVDCDTFKQELKEKLMRTTEKSSAQTRTATVPMKRVHKLLKCQERLGETSINTAGEKMEIVKYDGCEDMTVRFEDGIEKTGVRYEKFKRGHVKKPESWEEGSSKKKRMHNTRVKRWKRLGEVRKNKEGETMKIVQYNNANNMTVRFEDGTEKEGITYFNFERGAVRKDKSIVQKKEERLGEVRKNNAGETMEIVQYDNCANMTVRFEDGTEKEGVQYSNFENGKVSKPKREPVVNKEFLQRAEAYLTSAKVLLEGRESTTISSMMLCKKAVLNFLKSVLESKEEDIRYLGREVREKTGVALDSWDLAWLNDFNFKPEESWLQPTIEDITLAIEIAEKIGKKVGKVSLKT